RFGEAVSLQGRRALPYEFADNGTHARRLALQRHVTHGVERELFRVAQAIAELAARLFKAGIDSRAGGCPLPSLLCCRLWHQSNSVNRLSLLVALCRVSAAHADSGRHD